MYKVKFKIIDNKKTEKKPKTSRNLEEFERMTENKKQAKTTDIKPKCALDTAIFAGGCFWCMNQAF